jgi:hypothetical protein
MSEDTCSYVWCGGHTFEGKYTDDLTEYLASWDRVKKILEEKLEIWIYAFDPDFGVGSVPGGRTVSLPVWFVERLLKSWEVNDG